MRILKRHVLRMVSIAAVLLLLGGCGGGDGEDAPVNRSPSANAGPDQTVDAGSVVMLFGSGSDSDGTVTSIQWSQTAGATVSLSMQDQLLTSFVAPEVDADTTFIFRLTVTDDDGATASDEASVTVHPVVPTEGPFILGMGRLDDPAFRLQ